MEFSLDAYRSVITGFAEAGYAFLPFDEAEADPAADNAVYLRHDVDFDLEAAVEMARANRALGVSGCFFLLPRHNLYNLASPDSIACIGQILHAGQTIGLHFALPPNGMEDVDTIHGAIAEELGLIETLTGFAPLPVMSWHNPANMQSDYRHLVWRPVPGIINAYALGQCGIDYKADTNRRYSVEAWLAMPDTAAQRLQLCFHPILWVHGGRTMEQTLARSLRATVRRLEPAYADNDVYRECLPDGLPRAALKALTAPLED
jgi:hypothetical protein